MRTLAIIPARAGSKGIPHKNTRLFLGLPLVAHAILAAQETCTDSVVTTDDPAVAEIAVRYGVEVLIRPSELAQDDTPMLPVIQHAMMASGKMQAFIVLVQPTSPSTQRASYICEALRLLKDCDVDSVVSVSEIPDHFAPEHAVRISNGRLVSAIDGASWLDRMPKCRQAVERAYHRDGTVYAIRRATIETDRLYGESSLPLIIPAHDSVTLDTEEDWFVAEKRGINAGIFAS